MQWSNRLPLIAILRGITPQQAHEHISALINTGFDTLEIPLNSPQWQITIPALLSEFSSQVIIGAGTVLNNAQVDTLAVMGCRFMVTPNTQPAVIRHAVACGITVCAGCATVSEAFNALDAGALALKIFPAANFGPGYIHALKAVLPPQIPIFAVGGVTTENLAQWLKAGCTGVGLGNDLYHTNQPISRTIQQAERFIKAYYEAIK